MVAYKKISMRDLHGHLKSLGTDEVILDVRSADEFRSGHVPGSLNIPHDRVYAHKEELQGYKTVYVHCQAGVRSMKASDVLAGLGLTNIVCIAGSGMGDWIACGFPVERG